MTFSRTTPGFTLDFKRALEVIITDLCECELNRPRKTEPLNGIIDNLNKEEKVPPHNIASMQSPNTLSPLGAHPKNFDPEQVKAVLINGAVEKVLFNRKEHKVKIMTIYSLRS